MNRSPLRWALSIQTIILCALSILPFLTISTKAKRGPTFPGRRVIVIDESLAALRERPDLRAPLIQRLRRGRVVGLLAGEIRRDGEVFHRVAISRNRSGWVLAAAIVRPGSRSDGERLLRFVEKSEDDFARVTLALICERFFRESPEARRVREILDATLIRVADRLTRDARRRLGERDIESRRAWFLSYAGLDRYNRLGIIFDYDVATDCLIPLVNRR